MSSGLSLKNYYLNTEMEKEKLEKELEFLKESFESEVISEEEYISGKERIEKHLNELKNKEQESEERKEYAEGIAEEKKIEAAKKTEKKKKIKKNTKKEKEEFEEKPEEAAEEEKEIEKEEEEEEIKAEEEKYEEKPEEEFEEEDIEKTTPASDEEEPKRVEQSKQEEGIASNTGNKRNWKFFIAGLLALVIIAVLAVPFFNGKNTAEVKNNDIGENLGHVAAEIIACSSDKECEEEGKIGTCINPGTKDSECEFRDIVATELIVVNTKDCFNCDTTRMLNLLKESFPGLYVNSLDYSSDEGKNLINDLGIEMLPAYVFDANLSNAFNFEKMKGAFNGIDGKYAMNQEASGASYFISREIIPKRLDVFLIEGEPSAVKTEQNLEEFLNLFKGNVRLFKHDRNDPLTKELKIKTFPVFLINNKIRFSGVQPPDKIRENFCQLNALEECSEELSKNLI